jgi:hypothetical protein
MSTALICRERPALATTTMFSSGPKSNSACNSRARARLRIGSTYSTVNFPPAANWYSFSRLSTSP